MKIHTTIRHAAAVMAGTLKAGLMLSMLMLFQSQIYALTVQTAPESIPINIGYNGANLTITGQRAPDQDIVIKITSPAGEAKLKYKGKAGGIFWMKLGDMVFTPVPPVYVVVSSKNLEQILNDSALSENDLGYKALAKNIKIEQAPEGIDVSRWIAEFFKFKEHENLYAIKISDQTGLKQDASGKYQVQVDWPYQAPPGKYKLEAFAVRDQQVVDHADTAFTVKRSGLVALLSDLAFNQAALYGIIAILVAALAGFSVGFVFKGGGGH